MARHDDRERVSPERLTHGAGRAGRAEPSRDLAVGERRTRRNGARDLVDAAVERGQALHVEPNAGEIARVPAEERDDSVEGTPHVGWRGHLAGAGKSPQEARARLSLVHLRELHADDPARAPRDAASANRRIEEREVVCRHDAPRR